MTQLESAKKINDLKAYAIQNGGYNWYKVEILKACKEHKRLFGKQKGFIDLTPRSLVPKKSSNNKLKGPNMATKKAAAKPATKKKKASVKKACRSIIKQEGVKSNGTLKKGYKYKKGGSVVKVKAKPAAKKKVAAKKPAKRKPAAKKK